MTVIREADFTTSIADALQFISYYHPLDFIQAMEVAYHKEQNPAAKDAIAQILINSRMAAEGHRPICQDTGIVTCFVKVGMQVRFDSDKSLQELVDTGVRIAYANSGNPLRASIVADPAGARKNTRDNTPAVVHTELVAGDKVEVIQLEGRIELVPVRSAESMRGFLKRLTNTFERETDRCLP